MDKTEHALLIQVRMYSGLSAAVLTVLRLLDEKGLLPKEDVVEALRGDLDKTLAAKKGDPLRDPQVMAFRALIFGLSEQQEGVSEQDWMEMISGRRDS